MTAEQVQSILQAGVAFHQRGELAQAERMYRRVLEVEPNHAAAMGLLGVVAHQTGHRDDAEVLLKEAVAIAPSVALWNNLGVVQMEVNRLAGAERSFRRALELDGQSVETLTNLGNVLGKLGMVEEGMELLRNAERLASEQAKRAGALTGMGELLFHSGRRGEGVARHREALSVDPNHVIALNNLGKALERDDPVEAAGCFEKALKIRPTLAESWTNLAGISLRGGMPTSALEVLRRALSVNPRSGDVQHAMGRALMMAGRVRESIEHRRRAVELDAGNDVVHSGLLWALSYDERAEARGVFEEHLRWGERHGDAGGIRDAAALCPGVEGGPIRVGYVSGDFREHAAAHFIEPVLRHHDPDVVGVICYSTSVRSDHVTERLKPLVLGWREIANLTDERAAEMIREDEIDVLIDLAGHTRGGRLKLFARRPAPVQVTWIGYCATTGMKAMDYWITDALVDPVGQTEWVAVEKLVRLPRTLACYRPPEEAPEVVGEAPAGRTGFVTFGSFNRAAKLNDAVVEVWSRILREVEGSRLLLVFPSLHDLVVHEEMARRFVERGVRREQLDIRPSQPMKEYLAMHGEVDVVLDPFPFTGHTTTLHTLWMGVPVITLAGRTHVSRRGVSVMTNLGLEEWIATTEEEYVAIAKRAAGDVEGLSQLRRGMRERMLASPLMRYEEFTRDVEAALRGMCEGR